MKRKEEVMRYYLVKLREEKGYSMRKLAREADISFQYYSKLENGEKGDKMSLIVAGKIAKALNIDLSNLYFLEIIYQRTNNG